MDIISGKRARPTTLPVYILSGHAYVAKQLVGLLDREASLEVQLAPDVGPDEHGSPTGVVVVDKASLGKPLEVALREMAILLPGAKFIVIAQNEAALTDLLSMQRLGVHGWIIQEDIGTCLIPTILAVRQGLRCARTQDTPMPTEAIERLSGSREREVYEMLRRGFPNGEIAVALGVSASTVKTYVSNIFQKLGINRRRDLALDRVPTGRSSHGFGLVARPD